MQNVMCIAGVDVAKAELVISTDPDSSAVQTIANTEAAITGWLQTLAPSTEQMDQLLLKLMEQEPQLQSAAQRLQSITGFGLQAAVRLTALFSRISFANANAVVAYSGLDPRANDSGTKHGRRRISKRGPAALRRQMYLAGFAACHSHAFKEVYASLRVRMSSTQAIVVLARKLLRIAWAVWTSGQDFDIAKFKAKSACKKT